MKSAGEWINSLGLIKHPEGGYYREIYRSEESLASQALPSRYDGSRTFSTSIYFLIKQGEPSRFHRLRSDEIWFYHVGDAIEIYLISPSGHLSKQILGSDVDRGERLQVVIPHGSWFAAHVCDGGSYGLMGCVVAPGFEFEDFELAATTALAGQFPQHENLIRRLT